ncbi:MAG: YfhO family protein [Limisphaerales bacterium]
MNITRVKTEPSPEMSEADDWMTPGRFALVLGLLIFATFPTVLLGSSTFVVRDFGLFAYPLAYFHRESFWRGELPLWDPLNNCGLPFLAQWNTLTLYPLSLIYLLPPLTWSLPLFCLAHLFWGGLGMYFLAYRWTHHRLAAALGGVVFAFNGLSLNALMWPNVEAALGWFPWVVWLGQRAWREGGGKALAWGTAAGAMQMLTGGPETIVLTWLILLVLACGDWIHEKTLRRKMLWRFLGLGVLVALVCAVQLLPFLELLAHSERENGNYSASHDWPMPIWGWANFLVPLFRTSPTAQGLFMQRGQYWTSSYYAGIGTVLLVAVAVWRVRDWRVRAMAVLVLLGLVLALGDGTLLYRGLRVCFPGIGFVRYPVKFVILILTLAPLLAASAFTILAGNIRPAGRFELVCALTILALIGTIVALDWKSAVPPEAWSATWQSGLSRAAFLLLMVLFAAALFSSRGRQRILCGCLLLVLFWLDFATHVPTQNPTVKPSVYAPGWAGAHLHWSPQPRLGESRAMLALAAQETLRSHVLADVEQNYMLSRLAFLADCNLLEGVPQVFGFFSLTPREAYRATMLPYVDPYHDFAALLDFMGVSQTTTPGTTFDWMRRPTAMPIVSAGQRPVFVDDRTAFQAFYQTNLDFRHIVVLPLEARGSVIATQQTSAHVLDAKFANQSISIQTEAPAASLVVISQSHYPAWRAYVDGRPTKIWRANYAFQALEVPAGRHQIKLVYVDKKLFAGAVLSGLGLLACAGLWVLAHFPKVWTREPRQSYSPLRAAD